MKAPREAEKQAGLLNQAHAANAGMSELSNVLAAHYGSVSVQGFATHSLNPHAENIDPSISSNIAYTGLPMPSVAGMASTKVGKRKSRAIRKPPIKVFSADSSNFMAMVHRLTGFESSAYLLAGSHQASPVLKPFAAGPAHYTSFKQGVYVPDPPVGDHIRTKSYATDAFSCALSQRMPSSTGQKWHDSTDDGSLCTKEGASSPFSSPSGTSRLPIYGEHPAFEKVHAQVSRDSNSWDSCGAVFLQAYQGDSLKEECREEESCLSLQFKEQRRLHEEVGPVRH